jgi:TatD DNase family protein
MERRGNPPFFFVADNRALLIDTHNHLYFDTFDADRRQVLEEMRAQAVLGAVLIGIDPESSVAARDVVLSNPAQDCGIQLAYAVGLHPTSSFESSYFSADGVFQASDYLSPWWEDNERHGGRPPCAVGECGVDLYWDTNPLAAQQAVFRGQLLFARERDLPVIIHTRSADRETLEVIESVPGTRGVFHCFNGSQLLLDFALRNHAAGGAWYISFAGNLTNSDRKLEAAARSAPLERLLVETDAPFMTPKPVREQHPRGSKPRCEPAHVVHTAACLAELRGIPLEELAASTAANSVRCFGVNWLAP